MRNTALLEATMAQIREHPELHDQEQFFVETDCGTASCFGGWACALAGYDPQPGEFGRSGSVLTSRGVRSAWDVAQQELGLTSREAHVLFGPANSRKILELMVEDLVNGGELQMWSYYDALVR